MAGLQTVGRAGACCSIQSSTWRGAQLLVVRSIQKHSFPPADDTVRVNKAARAFAKPSNSVPHNISLHGFPVSRRHFSAAASGASAGGDVVPFNLADIGEGIAEVEVLQWFVQVGDHVNAFDRICEVQSDKATVEISSRFDGEVVKIYHEVGGMANVGEPLVDIRRSGGSGTSRSSSAQANGASSPASSAESKVEDAAKPEAGAKVHANGAQPQREAAEGKHKPLATPAVRGLIKGMNLEIGDIQGTGRDGRVTKEDVQQYLATKGKFNNVTIDPPSGVADQTPSSEASITSAPPAPMAASAPGAAAEEKRVKVRGFMRTMIKTMQAQTAIPHFGYSDEYEIDGILNLRQKLLDDAKGTKLTYMPIIIKAMSIALSEFPELNSKFSKDLEEVIFVGSHNIGIAVDTPTGLVVPNIKNVQDKSIWEIAQELESLVHKARDNQLSQEQLSGGTITLSNIGAIGGTYASPILMPGEACIGAIGAIETLPRYQEDGSLAPVRVMRISWSADHRLLAGAAVARFSNRLKGLLRDPSRMLLSLR